MLWTTLKQTQTALLSLFILTLGSGLLMTLLPLRLHAAHASVMVIGANTAAYYAGLVIGSFRIERFIQRVGHIRAFSAFASAFAVICLLQGLWPNPWFWVATRLVGGFCTAALFIVIESWLLAVSTINTRGQILAFYMIALYGAQAFGQLLLVTSPLKSLVPFILISMLASLAVIPLAMTKAVTPECQAPSTLTIKKLYRLSASGLLGSFASGLLLSVVYGLLPLFFAQLHLSVHKIAILMAAIIFGGMCLQYPIGRLSDTFDRRIMLIIMSLLTATTSLLLLLFVRDMHWAISLTLGFLLGGTVFTLYPLSISLASDNVNPNDIVAATQSLLLIYSIGATVGPLIATVFMHTITYGYGLLTYLLIIPLLLAAFLLWLKSTRTVLPDGYPQAFVSVPQTTPISAELDPRTDET